MSDDNLEALSNADLRSKCLQYGLPNVPITDSSRNVLIKKLRLSMGGAPAAVAQKKTSRRETIHNSKTIEVVESAVVEKEKNVTSRTAARRTIAGTTTSVAGGQTVVDAKMSQEKESSIPAPIGTRRRSSVREQEKPPQKIATATLHPTIILESEDDDELVLAAEKAEKISTVPSRPLDAVSLSKSTVVTTSSITQKTFNPAASSASTQKKIGEIYSVDAKNQQANPLDKYILPLSQQSSAGFSDLPLDLHTEHTIYSQPLSSISTSRYNLDSSASRYGGFGVGGGGGVGVGIKDASSYYSPSLRYNTSSGATSLRSKVSSLYNEQSDTEGNVDDERYQTPFLSNFARNLERIKTEPIATEGRYRNYKPYEITGRRPKNVSLKESLLQLWVALDNKYHIKRYVLIFLIFCLLAIFYVIFFQ